MKNVLAKTLSHTPRHYLDSDGPKPTYTLHNPSFDEVDEFIFRTEREVGFVYTYQEYFKAIAEVDEKARDELFEVMTAIQELERPAVDPDREEDLTEEDIEAWKEYLSSLAILTKECNEIEDALHQHHESVKEAYSRLRYTTRVKRRIAFRMLVDGWENVDADYERDHHGVSTDLGLLPRADVDDVGDHAVNLLEHNTVPKKS
jgi:hypothetical protein